MSSIGATKPIIASSHGDITRPARKASLEIPHLRNEAFHVMFIVLPILKEFEMFSIPAYIIADVHYLFTCLYQLVICKELKSIFKELIITSLAVGYLFWTIVESDLGDKIWTVHDMLYNMYKIISGLGEISYREAFESIFDIINDGVWLSSYYFCYVEIEALSYGIDMLSYLYYTIKDWKDGNKLDFLGELVMTGIRMHNVVSYIPIIREKPSSGICKKEEETWKPPRKLIIKQA